MNLRDCEYHLQQYENCSYHIASKNIEFLHFSLYNPFTHAKVSEVCIFIYVDKSLPEIIFLAIKVQFSNL